jgi:hypothetical protein
VRFACAKGMKKFAVYTVITNNYDELLQPKVVDDRFDYILFSDEKREDLGVWTFRPIPVVVKGDAKRLSRYPKTHPETLLAEYAASLYIDANIQIQDQWVYDRFVELYGRNVEYAGIKLVLTGRDCIYDHAYDMCQWFLEHFQTALRQCHRLYVSGFPAHYGLNENNIIFRSNTEKMKQTDEQWWKWIQEYSWRDQFSYMYCLWHNQVELNYFLPEGEDARNGRHFLLIYHDGKENVQASKLVRRSLLRRVLVKCNSLAPDKALARWTMSYRSSAPVLCYYAQSLAALLVSTPALIAALLKANRD